MGNTVGDLTFTDNPKRRDRAEQLYHDILQLVQDFDRAKRQNDDVFNELNEELNAILSNLGVNTRDELDRYVRDRIKNDADLEAYDRLRKQIDENDRVQCLIFDITSLIGIGILGAGALAALMGIISFAAFLGVSSAVAGVASILALELVILSVVEGAIQREKLREAINMMIHKRAEVYQQVLRMRALNTWAHLITQQLKRGNSFEDLKGLLIEGLKEPWDKYTPRYCYETLRREIDEARGSWMDEDGYVGY